MVARKYKTCAKKKSTCTKKGLKAELKARAYSKGHLAKLARSSTVTKTGLKRTKTSLINIILRKKARSVARKLGLTLVTK
jgi:hypothetical protein